MANPFITGNISSTNTSTLDTYMEYAWDFQNDCFIYEDGKHKIVTENEALKVWIYKVLKTERWRYRAYDNAYGIELEQFIGTYTNNKDSSTELEQYIKEALIINPYIKSIDDISVSIDGDELSYDISLTTIYSSMTVTN